MTSDQPQLGKGGLVTDAQREIPATRPLAGSGENAGGDPPCWACLVCQECGAVVTEGHLVSCSRSCQ